MAKQSTKSGGRAGAKPGAGAAAKDAEAPKPKKSIGPVQFMRQVRQEGAKVTWTTRNETIVSTIMVFIMVAFASLFFFGVDQFWRMVVNFALGLDLSGIL